MTCHLRPVFGLSGLALAGLLLLGGCSAQNPPASPATTPGPTSSTGEPAAPPNIPEYAACRPLLAKLDALPCVVRRACPLRELLRELTRQAGIRFVVDEAALKDEGLSADEPLDLDAGPRLLEELLPELDSHQLGLVVRDGAMVVTTASRAADTRYRATFSLAWLVHDATTFEDAATRFLITAPNTRWQVVDGGGAN